MNEITKVHLGRQAFVIAIDAHKTLEAYLNAIKKHMGGSDEAVKEVELRIAELLTGRGISGDKVVLADDVDYIKEQLGKPGDFSEDGEAEADDEPPKENGLKRLFRDPQHGMIAGVAAGLASYLNVDAVFVRLGFVILTFFWGWGAALYVVLWLITPELKTKSDRLRAEGKAVTVDSLKRIVGRADVPGATQRATNAVRKVVQGCFRALGLLFGVAFTLAGAAALLGVMTAGAYMLLKPEHAFQQDLFLVNGSEVALLTLGLLAAAIISVFLLLIGVAMIRYKWTLQGWIVAAMLGVFLVSVAVGTALTPGVVQDVRQRYEAAHHTTKRPVQSFTKLRVLGSSTVQVTFVPSSEYGIEARYFGQANPALITTTVADGTLTIDPEKFTMASRCKAICLYYDPILKITVHAPGIEQLAVEGSGTMFSADALHQTSLGLRIEPGAYANLSHVRAGKALWTASPGKTDELQLSDVRSDPADDAYVNAGGGLSLGYVGELQVNTQQTCDAYSSWVSVLQADKLVINDKSFASPAELSAAQTPNSPSIYNCVMVDLPRRNNPSRRCRSVNDNS